MSQLLTVGQIADDLNRPSTRVAYAIDKLRIKPVRRVGIIRLFGADAIDQIRSGVMEIEAKKK